MYLWALFYVLLIFFLAKGSRAVIQTIRKRHRFDIKNTLIKGLGYLSIFYGIFMVFWGFAYHRRPYQATRGVHTANIKTPELEALCLRLAHLAKHYRQQLPAIRSTPTDFNSVFKRAPLGYQQLSKTAPELTVDVPSLKLGFSDGTSTVNSISAEYIFHLLRKQI